MKDNKKETQHIVKNMLSLFFCYIKLFQIKQKNNENWL